jgi:hypothetical protein
MKVEEEIIFKPESKEASDREAASNPTKARSISSNPFQGAAHKQTFFHRVGIVLSSLHIFYERLI